MLLTDLLLELPPEERALQAAALLPASLIEYADTLAQVAQLLQLGDTQPAAMAAVAAQVAAEAQRAQDREVREASGNISAECGRCGVHSFTRAHSHRPPFLLRSS